MTAKPPPIPAANRTPAPGREPSIATHIERRGHGQGKPQAFRRGRAR